VAAEIFPGIYRAVIEVTDDPQQRKRYRVRVANIHPPAVEVNHLPWAELGTAFGGGQFGDLPAYEVGDPVWVMFEGADRRFPVVMGGILNFEGGIPPLPVEQSGDYTRTSKRWTRIDRIGNKIEMSPLAEEQWVKLETADGSFVKVSGRDGTITVQAEGRVVIQAKSVQIEGAETITATTVALTADVEETATLRCRGVVNIRATDEINIGEYEPPTTPVTVPVPETTLAINIKAAQSVKIESAGTLDVDSSGVTTIDSASTLAMKSVSAMSIETDANLSITVEGAATIDVEGNLTATVQGNALLDVNGTTTIDGTGNITIEGGADIEVTATSQFTITAGAAFEVQGNANIEVTANANLSLTCVGEMALDSNSVIELTAPIVRLNATSLAEVLSGGVARVNGGTVLLGS